MNHLNNLNSVECHCLLYKFSWTDKIRADNLACDFECTASGRGLSHLATHHLSHVAVFGWNLYKKTEKKTICILS